jgi:hypothetical protein
MALFVVSGAREQCLHLPYDFARFLDLIFPVPLNTTRRLGHLSQAVSIALQITINKRGFYSN